MKPQISAHVTAQRIDALLADLATLYRTLPRSDHLPIQFREALSSQGLPGGYARKGMSARPLHLQLYPQPERDPQC